MKDRLFMDTVFAQALLNPRDQYRGAVLKLLPRYQDAEVWVTEPVLIELADGLAAVDRASEAGIVARMLVSPEARLIPADRSLLLAGLTLYESRRDKERSLTDRISFVVTSENGLTDALTADKHFIQAGFRALLREEP